MIGRAINPVQLRPGAWRRNRKDFIGETLDLAVVLPQLLKSFPQRLSAAVIARSAEKAVQARYGFRTWPALVDTTTDFSRASRSTRTASTRRWP